MQLLTVNIYHRAVIDEMGAVMDYRLVSFVANISLEFLFGSCDVTSWGDTGMNLVLVELVSLRFLSNSVFDWVITIVLLLIKWVP